MKRLSDKEKSAFYKYEVYREAGETLTIKVSPKPIPNLPDLYVRDEESDITGTLVFTGQPDYRKEHRHLSSRPDTPKNTGKVYEFVFFPTNNHIHVSEEVMTNFRAAYFDFDNPNNQSIDWKYWKNRLESHQKIPVFYRPNKDLVKEQKGPIKDMGLSYLYKITYKHSAKELIQTYQNNHCTDFSEAVWGYTNDTDALKRQNTSLPCDGNS